MAYYYPRQNVYSTRDTGLDRRLLYPTLRQTSRRSDPYSGLRADYQVAGNPRYQSAQYVPPPPPPAAQPYLSDSFYHGIQATAPPDQYQDPCGYAAFGPIPAPVPTAEPHHHQGLYGAEPRLGAVNDVNEPLQARARLPSRHYTTQDYAVAEDGDLYRDRRKDRRHRSGDARDAAIDDFTLEPRQITSAVALGDTKLDEAVTVPDLTKSRPKASSAYIRRNADHRVIRSKYTGDGSRDSEHTAELEVTASSHPGADGMEDSAFRWIHFDAVDHFMNLKSFQTEVERSIPDSRLPIIKRLFAKVNSSEKPPSVTRRSGGRNMEADVIKVSSKDSDKQVGKDHDSMEATWMCFPYFFADRLREQERGLNSALHHVTTVMQMRYPSTDESRDLRQAACQLNEVDEGHCVQIAKLWCVLIGQSTLFTYAIHIPDEMSASAISIDSKPGLGPSLRSKYVLVTDGKSRSWLLNREDCATWRGFLSHFKKVLPELEFSWNSTSLSANNWAWLLKSTSETLATIMVQEPAGIKGLPSKGLDLEAWKRIDNTHKAVANRHLGNVATLSSNTASKTQTTARADAAPLTADHTALQGKEVIKSPSVAKNLAVLLRFRDPGGICRSTRGSSDSRAGRHARVILHQVESDLEAMNASLMQRSDDGGRAYKSIYSETASYESPATSLPNDVRAQETASVFQLIYEFFVPHELTGTMPTLGQYAVATDKLLKDTLQMDQMHNRILRHRYRSFYSIAKRTARACQNITMDLNGETSNEPLRIPPEWYRAWLSAVLAVVAAAQACHSDLGDDEAKKLIESAESHMRQCLESVKSGWKIVKQSMSRPSLDDLEQLGPSGILNILTNHLIDDKVGLAHSVSEIYMQQLINLEQAVQHDPTGTSHRIRLDEFKEEIVCISDVVSLQTHCLDKLRDLDEDGTRPFLTYNPRSEILILEDSCVLSRDKGEALLSMQKHAEYLMDLNARSIDQNKDQHETAIYAFTIVTVIFLPLSTVAGILGMNTTDIRNLEQSQWLFWAIAAPLSIFVILATFSWGGQMKHIRDWMVGRMSDDGYSASSTRRQGMAGALFGSRGYGATPDPPLAVPPIQQYAAPPYQDAMAFVPPTDFDGEQRRTQWVEMPSPASVYTRTSSATEIISLDSEPRFASISPRRRVVRVEKDRPINVHDRSGKSDDSDHSSDEEERERSKRNSDVLRGRQLDDELEKARRRERSLEMERQTRIADYSRKMEDLERRTEEMKREREELMRERKDLGSETAQRSRNSLGVDTLVAEEAEGLERVSPSGHQTTAVQDMPVRRDGGLARRASSVEDDDEVDPEA